MSIMFALFLISGLCLLPNCDHFIKCQKNKGKDIKENEQYQNCCGTGEVWGRDPNWEEVRCGKDEDQVQFGHFVKKAFWRSGEKEKKKGTKRYVQKKEHGEVFTKTNKQNYEAK